MDRAQIIEILEGQFGGNLWENYGKCRVYFNGADIAARQGLDWGTYNTGNISSATLDGEKISNSEAKRILAGFGLHKIWFDFADGQFHTRGVAYESEIQYPTSREMYDQFVADAMAAIA